MPRRMLTLDGDSKANQIYLFCDLIDSVTRSEIRGCPRHESNDSTQGFWQMRNFEFVENKKILCRPNTGLNCPGQNRFLMQFCEPKTLVFDLIIFDPGRLMKLITKFHQQKKKL